MITCIAIDDEPLALKQITGYIAKTPFLELKGQFESALQSLAFLHENEIDLMFVDINMPDLNGLEFVKSLEKPPSVIFTTAYSEYAIEGFQLDAVDYLLKPIGYSDFIKSANKAKSWFDLHSKSLSNVKKNDDFLFIKTEYKIVRINFNDIKYIEGMREYVRIHLLNEKPVMTLASLKKLEDSLPDNLFMRVHRSYIVNLNHITTIERNRIVYDEKVYIPVSEQYNSAFKKYIDTKFMS